MLGGYKGFWSGRSGSGKEKGGEGVGKGKGKGEEKRRLLEEEGVVFDVEGKARGLCFGGFVDLGGKGK